MMLYFAEIFYLLSTLTCVLGLPSWDGLLNTNPVTSSSIGSLVPGASVIEALGSGISYEGYKPKYLNIGEVGAPGSVNIQDTSSPPVFFINNQQLWQLNNQSSILHVNIMNVTGVPGELGPLKMQLSEKSAGVQDGVWRWRGTRLFYDLGKRSNNGLWFSCQSKGGKPGVYTSLDPGPAPNGCTFTTLHSFVNRADKP